MKKNVPNVGDIRIRKEFLIFPLTINNERRWWETAVWKEEYRVIYTGGPANPGLRDMWVPIEWSD